MKVTGVACVSVEALEETIDEVAGACAIAVSTSSILLRNESTASEGTIDMGSGNKTEAAVGGRMGVFDEEASVFLRRDANTALRAINS